MIGKSLKSFHIAGIALAVLALALPASAHDGGVSLRFGAGITSLQYGGTEFLADGHMSVQKATLRDTAGHPTDAGTVATATLTDPSAHTVTQTFPWGVVRCGYTAAGSRLNITIGVINKSAQPLAGIWIQPITLKFPHAPQGWSPNYVYMGTNAGAPTVNYANFGSGSMAVCNDDVSRPLLCGFPGRPDLLERPVWVCTSNIGWLSPMLDSVIVRPIPPGKTDTFHISIRFGGESATAKQLAGDIYHKFATTYPQTLRWADRRCIAALHLSTSEPEYHPASNPRGWFMDKSLDATSEAGRAAFRKRLLDYADESIRVLKNMNAQGMVTWDIEGQQYPHATSYIGDPRLVGTLAPEMDVIADDYFRKFRDAGLRTGVCVRPQMLSRTADKTEQQWIDDPDKISDLLYAKIAYANKRWGCTLFYVDSNGDPNVPFDVAIFQRVASRLKRDKIEALLMPEHQATRYYAYTAPYDELRQNITGTPDAVTDIYPGAFGVIYAPDGPIEADHDALVAAVKRGDILMFRGWWDDPQNAAIKKIYTDAGK